MILEILALDSLVNVLTLKERVYMQKQRGRLFENDFMKNTPITVSLILVPLIIKHNWKPPERKFNPALEEIWYNVDAKQWQPINSYQHPILQEVINQILIKE